jgi:hypothetical protein
MLWALKNGRDIEAAEKNCSYVWTVLCVPVREDLLFLEINNTAWDGL